MKKTKLKQSNNIAKTVNPFKIEVGKPTAIRGRYNIQSELLIESLDNLPVSTDTYVVIPKEIADDKKKANGLWTATKKQMQSVKAKGHYALKTINDINGKYVNSRIYRVS